MKTESEIRTVLDALTAKIEIESEAIPKTLQQACWAGMYAAFRFVVGESVDDEAFQEIVSQYPPDKYQVVRFGKEPVTLLVHPEARMIEDMEQGYEWRKRGE